MFYIYIELARHAESIGADAIAVIPPWAPSRVIRVYHMIIILIIRFLLPILSFLLFIQSPILYRPLIWMYWY